MGFRRRHLSLPRRAPMATAPLIIRWRPHTSSDAFNAQHPSYVTALVVGFQFPMENSTSSTPRMMSESSAS